MTRPMMYRQLQEIKLQAEDGRQHVAYIRHAPRPTLDPNHARCGDVAVHPPHRATPICDNVNMNISWEITVVGEGA